MGAEAEGTKAPAILLAGPPAVEALFGPAAEIIRQAGVAVIRTDDAAAYMADPAQRAGVGVIVTGGACPAAAMQDAPSLRGVVSPFTGYEGIDVAAATDLGLLVANGQAQENVDSLAEATVLLTLACLYDLKTSEAVVRDNLPKPATRSARMLKGKTIGLIGFGRTAQGVAMRLQPWGATLLATARRPLVGDTFGATRAELDDLLANSDVVIVLASLNAETHGLLNAERLERLKPDVLLVNVARGPIIDEAALTDLLRRRPQMRAALDVFEVEPLPQDSPLRGLPNVMILTQHMVAHTREALIGLSRLAADQALDILAGRTPTCVCNSEALPAWQARWLHAEAPPDDHS